MKIFYRFLYSLLTSISWVTHVISYNTKWWSYKAMDRMGGRRRAKSQTLKKIMKQMRIFIFHKFLPPVN